MQKEIWKAVVGYEGSYEVSDMGRVRSLDRITSHGHKRKGKELRPVACQNGYLAVFLSMEGLVSNKTVHRLVAESFLGQRPQKLVVDHIDNSPSNNCADNLRYISNRLNCSKDKKGDLPTGVSASGAKYKSLIQVNSKPVYLGTFDTPKEAGEVYLKKLLTLGE